MNFLNDITIYLETLTRVINNLDKNEINRTMQAILKKYNEQATIYIFGNGGSAATASHFVCDFNKGACMDAKNKFRFICLNDNTPIITAIANDISYDDIFSYQLQGVLSKNDMVIAISGSGNSKNIIKAVKYAKEIGCEVVGITGYDGGLLKKYADYSLHVDINDMQKVEDVHMAFDHMMMQIFSKYLLEQEAK
ncbi:D-sedoheptulose 7-phosphate isomerase [Clostridium amylolyticum]|uniref:D-sedoheptulose 7-phosphate isomerase n=1 Tax=Clostridium amylolyticum TaxID=1121298 RepID=A0A1M6M7X7_9CLOT|nr:SIS domain-containing protein [Clostridium amylolyticum]SHJ79546.1 D-sedoheptulose 7-phosphate isomerase [Clostridium amylolyticum]